LVERTVAGHLVPRREDATLEDLRKACKAAGLVVDDASLVNAAIARAEKAEAENATLRIKLDTAHAVVYATRDRNEWKRLYDEEAARNATIRSQLAAAEARIARAEQEAEVPLDTLTWSYVEACKSTGVSRGDLQEGVAYLQKRAEKAEAELATVRAQLAAAEATATAAVEALEKAAALTPTEGRATDGDIQAMAESAYRLRSREDASLDDMRKLALAVAARVRREGPARQACRVTDEELLAIHAAHTAKGAHVGAANKGAK
jgi:hypothetical protein